MKNSLTLCLIVLSASLLAKPALSAEDWGNYTGSVETRWLDEQRKMQLLSDYEYTGPRPLALKWKAPKDSVVDGASIPQVFWSIVGGPFDGLYRNASVLHDIACDEKKRPWAEVHLMFYQAMRCSGVPIVKAKTMYWAVYHFGPRWRAPNLVERFIGLAGTEVPNSRELAGTRSRWSRVSREWTRNERAPQRIVRVVESPTPPPAADPARVSAEDIRRFEQWVADENPSLSDLQTKSP